MLRGHLAFLYRYVAGLLELDGHERPQDEAVGFLSLGFLINAAMAIGLESELSAEEWAGICGQYRRGANRRSARAAGVLRIPLFPT